MGVARIRLGKVLVLSINIHAVEADEIYPQIGMLNLGRGTFKKSDLLGSDTKYKKLQSVRAGQVIYSKLKAFEGALGVVPIEHDSHFVSQEFPTFNVIPEAVDVSYLLQVFETPDFQEQLAKNSKGVGARRERLHPSAFLNIEVPLPSLTEQLRIAERLAAVQESAARAMVIDQRSVSVLDAIESGVLATEMAANVKLGTLVDVNPTPLRVTAGTDVAFAPMASLNVVTGRIDASELRARSEIGAGYKQFIRGDIVFARITPSMQNGKSAVFDDPNLEIGYGTTEFHVLRPKAPALAAGVHALVRSTWFKSRAMGSFTGTAGQQRVPAAFLENVTVPDLRVPATRAAIEGLKALEDKRWKLRQLSKTRIQLAEALPKSVRNEIFSNLG